MRCVYRWNTGQFDKQQQEYNPLENIVKEKAKKKHNTFHTHTCILCYGHTCTWDINITAPATRTQTTLTGTGKTTKQPHFAKIQQQQHQEQQQKTLDNRRTIPTSTEILTKTKKTNKQTNPKLEFFPNNNNNNKQNTKPELLTKQLQ